MNRCDIAKTGVLPSGYQLIQDDMPFQVMDVKKNILSESSGQKTPVMKLTGVFQKSGEKNANGRVYPKEVLAEAVKDLKDSVEARRIIGEFCHPPDAKINMDRASHIITKLWMEGKTVLGELEVINDDRCPLGNMLACYIDRGIQVGISSRGVGDMEMTLHEGEEAYEVQPGYQFITFDVVAEPSVKDAQLTKINEDIDRRISNRKSIHEKLLLKELGNYFHI
jgi:hypothetical protein